MKIILSRKGFDSSAGGKPSPIFQDGSMVSLPIPDEDSPIKFRNIISWSGENLGMLISDLTRGRFNGKNGAHLDPDLCWQSIARQDGWKPLFGQAGGSLSHLHTEGVKIGDLFLFFGMFREVEMKVNGWEYRHGSLIKHILWGWLQIGATFNVADPEIIVPEWAEYHPHCTQEKNGKNIIFVARKFLKIPGVPTLRLPGAGIFKYYHPSLQLTAPNSSKRSFWELPKWMYPHEPDTGLSHHRDLNRWTLTNNYSTLKTVGRGQEFVLDCKDYPMAKSWAMDLILTGTQKNHR